VNTRTRQIVYWAPRTLCVLFAFFLSLFALDVFEGGYGFGQAVLAFLIHLIPVFIVVIALVIAWRWEWVGAILFLAFALWYVIQTGGRQGLAAYVLISGPSLVIGLLFLLSWLSRKEIRAR